MLGQESFYYPLFNHLKEEHALILLDSELNEIVEIVRKLDASQPPAVKGAETTLRYINALQNRLIQLADGTENEFERGVINHRIGDLHVASKVIDRYKDANIDESPTAAGETIQIDYDWLALALADFATTYHVSKNKDLMNDVAEFLSDRLKGKGVEYVLDENERATAAGDGKEAMEINDDELFQLIEKIINEQYGTEPMDDMIKKMGMVKEFIFKQQNK